MAIQNYFQNIDEGSITKETKTCNYCYDRPVLQITGVNGELKEVPCPRCHQKALHETSIEGQLFNWVREIANE